ncbi:MAG: VanZ family protein [Phycisphaerae bacterium]|nr:VanZ family protein [Phycisphaerae bacterium]
MTISSAKLATKAKVNKFWLSAAICYTIVLLIATHIPQKVMDNEFKELTDWDKLLHIGAYAVLATLILFSLKKYNSMKLAMAIIAIIAFVGAIDELTQPYFGRSCHLDDWLADLAGAFLALLFLNKSSYFKFPFRHNQ